MYSEVRAWIVQYAWLIEALAIFSLLLIVNALLKKLLLYCKQMARSKNDWRIYLDHAAIIPARTLLWTLLLSFCIDLIARELHLENIFFWITPLRNTAIIFIVAWFFLRWKKIFYSALEGQRLKGQSSLDPISMDVLGKLFTIGVLFISLLIFLQLFGLDIVPFITLGGIGAAALGLAARDMIANFFGGLMLYMTRPFSRDDFVELPGKKMGGTIEEIGWYFTTMRDLHKRPIYIPNSVFTTELVVNVSRMSHRRVEESIGLRHIDRTKVEPIVEKIRHLLQQHPDIDQHQAIDVFLSTLSPYALKIDIGAYTLSIQYGEFMATKQKLLLEIYQIIITAGAAFSSYGDYSENFFKK